MKVFDIYVDENRRVYMVRNGFCWPGLFFAWIWTYCRGMYFIATMQMIAWWLFLGIAYSLWRHLGWIDLIRPLREVMALNPWVGRGLSAAFILFMVIEHLYVSVFGYNWVRSKWGSMGWERCANILAPSKKKAFAKFKQQVRSKRQTAKCDSQ